jgi:hypothetical protein
VALVHVLDDDLLGAVDGALGDPARQPGLPGQGGVAAGVDEAVRRDRDVPVAGRELDPGDTGVPDVCSQQHRAENRLDAEASYRPLEPAAEGHLVVVDGLGVAGLEMQVTGRPQVAENVVENPVGELAVFRAVAENAAEQPDQGMHHLAADERQRVDQHHVAVQPSRLDGRRQAGDPRADHAHVGADLVGGSDAGRVTSASLSSVRA